MVSSQVQDPEDGIVQEDQEQHEEEVLGKVEDRQDAKICSHRDKKMELASGRAGQEDSPQFSFPPDLALERPPSWEAAPDPHQTGSCLLTWKMRKL